MMRAFHVTAAWDPKSGARLTEEEQITRVVPRGGSVWRNVQGSLQDRPEPVAGPGEVVLRVGATGICGTDLMLLETDADGYPLHDAHSHFPINTGHEFSGTVVAVGEGVCTPEVGQHVAVESMNWCGVCDPCRRGMFNQCRNLREPGLTYDGGFAEYAAVPAKNCYVLDDLLRAGFDERETLEIGALVEPLAVAYNALFVTGRPARPGSHAVVFGAGPVGLAAVAMIRATGVGSLICFETSQARRDLAKQMGADHVIDPRSLAQESGRGDEIVMQLTGGRGAALFAECSGALSAVYPVIEGSMDAGAQVLQIGIGHGTATFDPFVYQGRAATLVGSLGQSGSGIYADVISLIANRRIDVLPIITDRVRLSDIEDGFARARGGAGGKVLIIPDSQEQTA